MWSVIAVLLVMGRKGANGIDKWELWSIKGCNDTIQSNCC